MNSGIPAGCDVTAPHVEAIHIVEHQILHQLKQLLIYLVVQIKYFPGINKHLVKWCVFTPTKLVIVLFLLFLVYSIMNVN